MHFIYGFLFFVDSTTTTTTYIYHVIFCWRVSCIWNPVCFFDERLKSTILKGNQHIRVEVVIASVLLLPKGNQHICVEVVIVSRGMHPFATVRFFIIFAHSIRAHVLYL